MGVAIVADMNYPNPAQVMYSLLLDERDKLASDNARLRNALSTLVKEHTSLRRRTKEAVAGPSEHLEFALAVLSSVQP